MIERIQLGHMGKYWNDDFKNLPYVNQGVTEEEISYWESLGYSEKYVKSYTGSMYDNRNPMPEWIDRLENAFGLFNQSYTFYRMDTCEIMPAHSDHFRTYCRLNDAEPDQVWRAVMMLEDWKPGHYFELGGVGYVNWKAGDWFKWQGDIPHAASNIGVEPRYTIQITGMSIHAGQLNKLFSFNIPDIEEDKSFPFATNMIVPKFTDKRNMVFMNNSYIYELDSINHTEETIDILNSEGLHIHLYEPICSYDVNNPTHTQGFYSEFSNIDSNDLRAEELDSIYNYSLRNNLTNITVHTGDYNVEHYYPYYTTRLTLICDDIFLKTMSRILNVRPVPENKFIRKFISLNWRFTKHRQLTANFLAGRNGYLSWSFKAEFDVLGKDLYFDLDDWKYKYPELYNRLREGVAVVREKSPFCVDQRSLYAREVTDPKHVEMWPPVDGARPGYTPSLYNQVSNHLSDFYFESFLDIVSETRFAQPTANISEKAFQPMQYFRPFVLLAPPKSLEYLRSLGFETFGSFWDESYDDELDHGERLAKIFRLIDSITIMTDDELRELYNKMTPILVHNFNRYKEITE